MTTMILELYDALREAGASEAKAQAAAKTMLGQEYADRALATKLDVREIRTDLATIRAELAMMRWVLGGTFLSVIMLLVKAFLPHG